MMSSALSASAAACTVYPMSAAHRVSTRRTPSSSSTTSTSPETCCSMFVIPFEVLRIRAGSVPQNAENCSENHREVRTTFRSVCPGRTPPRVPHAYNCEGGLKADAGAELCLPARAKVVAVEGALEVWRGNRRQVQRLLPGRRIDSGVADRDRAVQCRIETPPPVPVEQVQQIEHVHRQLDLRPAASRHGDAVTEIEAVDPRRVAGVADRYAPAMVAHAAVAVDVVVQLIPGAVDEDDLVGRGRHERDVVRGHPVGVRVAVEDNRVRLSVLAVVVEGR